MSEDSNAKSFKPLPIWSILNEAFTQVWARRAHFGQLLIIPCVLSIMVEYLLDKWLHIGGEEPEVSIALLKAIIYSIPFELVLTVFAIACHRSILLGDDAVPALGLSKWTKRESWFFAWSVLIGTATIIVGILVGVIVIISFGMLSGIFHHIFDALPVSVAVLGGGLPAMYLLGRLSLLLPATAVDQRVGVKWAWSKSRRHDMRLAFLVGFIPLSFIALRFLLYQGITNLLGEVFGSILHWLIYYCLATVEIVILSISFREITGFRHGN